MRDSSDPGFIIDLTAEDIIRPQIFMFIVDFEFAMPLAELLQTQYGGDAVDLRRFFPPEVWLPFPTWRMQAITGTEDEWHIVAGWWEKSRRMRGGSGDSSPATARPPPFPSEAGPSSRRP